MLEMKMKAIIHEGFMYIHIYRNICEYIFHKSLNLLYLQITGIVYNFFDTLVSLWTD